MMKKIIVPLIMIFLTPVAYAADVYVATEIVQGDTLEIRVPHHDIQSVSGSFNGKNLKFYEVVASPNWDEKITRGEFLKMMFENGDFAEGETGEVTVFPDVPEDNPYHLYISQASALDIIHGYEDGLFRPYTPITRGQIAKILSRAFNPPVVDEITVVYEDVPEDHRFYSDVNRAVAAGYFIGYPDGLMRPDRNINFDEADIVISRATGIEEIIGADEKGYYRALVGLHRTKDIGDKILNLQFDNTENFTKHIEVLDREVPVNSFSLPETKTELLAPEKQNDTWTKINSAKATTSEEILWNGEFIVPTAGTITLGFGNELYINGVFSGSHFGIDYANEEGTEVYASNNGVVTLSEETMSYGNTIIIDHGHNVFTMYLHLSELKVPKGQMVTKGDLIGLMGMTGVATGSHLHFTHFIGDIIVDSQEWFEGKF